MRVHTHRISPHFCENIASVYSHVVKDAVNDMRLVALLAFVAILIAGFQTTVDAFPDELIRCKVCQRAIEHVFRKGAELRDHCKSEERNDPRCDYSNLHSFGIEEMVHTACDDLPKTYQAIHDSEFEMVIHDDPQHSKEAALAIKRTCVKWVHDQGEEVSLYVFANLDAQKSAEVILPALQNRFCSFACNPDFVKKRDAHDEL